MNSSSIFSKITSLNNLYLAVEKLQKDQALLPDRHWLQSDLEQKLQQIQADLLDGSYTFQPIQYFYSWQHKYILSACLTCRDWVVHHAICLQLAPFFYKKQNKYSAYQPKDTDQLISQCQLWTGEYQYVLGVDIKSFFGSISHQGILGSLALSIEEKPVLKLIESFFKALNHAAFAFRKEEHSFNYQVNKGIPVGLELCYILANAYLQTMDKFLQKKDFVRYLDDFLIFSNDEKELWNLKLELDDMLQKLGLRFNEEKTFLRSTEEGFVYLSYKFQF